MVVGSIPAKRIFATQAVAATILGVHAEVWAEIVFWLIKTLRAYDCFDFNTFMSTSDTHARTQATQTRTTYSLLHRCRMIEF